MGVMVICPQTVGHIVYLLYKVIQNSGNLKSSVVILPDLMLESDILINILVFSSFFKSIPTNISNRLKSG